MISEEEKYDGFYAVYTNLEDNASEIAKINHDRWEILINTLSRMNMIDIHEGYIPAYKRTEVTDALHKNAGFRTDYEIIRKREMRGICRKSKE